MSAPNAMRATPMTFTGFPSCEGSQGAHTRLEPWSSEPLDNPPLCCQSSLTCNIRGVQANLSREGWSNWARVAAGSSALPWKLRTAQMCCLLQWASCISADESIVQETGSFWYLQKLMSGFLPAGRSQRPLSSFTQWFQVVFFGLFLFSLGGNVTILIDIELPL